MRLWALVLLATVLASAVALAEPRVPEVAPRESGVQITRFVGQNKTLYNFRWTITRTEEEGKTLLRFEGHGDNDLQGKARIEWTERSLAELTPGGLRSQYWKKDSRGAEQESWLLKYDWAKRKAYYRYVDHLSGKQDRSTIEIGPDAMPADWMYIMLRAFPFAKGRGYEQEGAFILTDGKVMDGAIVHRGEVRIKTAWGPMDCYKLELDPDGLTGVFAPSMYLYYTKTEPHLFVRFDGKDAGYFEDRTVNVLVGFEPAEWLGR